MEEEREHTYPIAEDIIGLHADILGCSLETAANQLRDQQALEGALARPLWHAHYNDADLAMQAAVLAHGIAEGQLFVDGNKRTALAAMLTFLELNGATVTASQEDRAKWILRLADGGTTAELAASLRQSMRSVS